MKFSKIIIFILIVSAFGAGIYFRDDFLKFYKQKTEIGQTILQVEKQIFSPLPLNAGGAETKVVLLQSKIIAETNLQRQENGNLPALEENKMLDGAAAAKAADMFKNQYFEHVSPAGVDPGKLVQSFGYDYIVAGENLILGNFSSEKEILQDWMNSPGHRANILNSRYTEIGAAIVKGSYKGETVWIGVQEFGLPTAACLQPNVALKTQIDFQKSQLDAMSMQIDEQKSEIENADSASPIYSQMVNDYNQLVGQYNSLAGQIKGAVADYNLQVNNFNNCVAGK